MRKDSLNSGDVFSRLTVVSLSHTSKRRCGSTGERVMNCKCECGSKLKVKTSNLKSGNTKSCGCLHSELTVKSNTDRGNVSSISEHICFQCECGSVNFSLLKSFKIECNSCGKLTNFKWVK